VVFASPVSINAQEHVIDPSIPLDTPAHVANSRLEMFNLQSKVATQLANWDLLD
jgi:hypothetical protein